VVAIGALLLGLSVVLRITITLQPPDVYGKDFLQEYVLARALVQGEDPYVDLDVLAERLLGQTPSRLSGHPTPHPPTLGALLLPLAFVDYPTAVILWFGFEALAILGSLLVIARGLGLGRLWLLPIFAVALVCWYPLRLELALGQLMVPLLLLLSASWWAWRSARSTTAGALLGLAILVKVMPWPLLVIFLVKRDWRAVGAAAAVVVAGYLSCLLAFGLPVLMSYLASLPEVAGLYRAHSANVSLLSLPWRLFEGTGSPVLPGLVAEPLLRSAVLATALSWLVPGAVMVAVCLAAWKSRSRDTLFAAGVCLSLLLSPIAWEHYLVLVVLPVAIVGAWLARRAFPAPESNAALGLALLLMVPSGVVHDLLLEFMVPGIDGNLAVPTLVSLLTMWPTLGVALLTCLIFSLESRPRFGDPAPARSPSRKER
jgi:hypothetical protein